MQHKQVLSNPLKLDTTEYTRTYPKQFFLEKYVSTDWIQSKGVNSQQNIHHAQDLQDLWALQTCFSSSPQYIPLQLSNIWTTPIM